MHSHPRWNRRTAGVCSRALAGAALVGSLVGAAALVSGCAQILGIDELSGGPRDAAAPPDASGPAIDAGPPDAGIDITCSEGEATSGAGATTVDTDSAGNEFAATCGGESSPDQMLVWTAPVTDYYSFDTFGSGFDTVLALFQECGGAELACSNNVGNMSQSELVYKLEQGQQALVLVDGAAGDSGQGALNIQRVACPDTDLEGQTFPLELSTLGFGDDLQGQCGGAGAEDRAYHWVAPADGLYYFRATSQSFTPVISLIDGPRCSDRVLACNPAVNREYGAEAVRFLRAGQAVSVVVDGKDGAGLFTLDIGLKASQVCPEAPRLTLGTEIADDFAGPTLSSSCGPTRSTGPFGELYEIPDKVYSFEVAGLAPPCRGTCQITVTAQQNFTLYALEGAECGGAEVACLVADVDQTSGTATATLSLDTAAEASFYTIVVADRFANDQGAGFTVGADCFAVC
jgi:hypothetical protein